MNHVRALLLSLLSAPGLLAACTTVDPLSTANIADLTTAQAETWCASTYEPMFLQPTDSDWPVQSDGTVVFGTGGGAIGTADEHHGGATPPGTTRACASWSCPSISASRT